MSRIKENRTMLIKVLRVIYVVAGFIIGKKEFLIAQIVLSIADKVAKYTKNTVDDKVMAVIASIIFNETKHLDAPNLGDVTEAINSKKSGPLKKIEVAFDRKRGLTVYYGEKSIEYNHSDGSFKCRYQ